jgi:O-antigen/teichoic acid export membrane protein
VESGTPDNADDTLRSGGDFASLNESIRWGIVWTGAAKWVVQLLSWASTIFVVRALTPKDYGIVGMATVFVAVLQPICDFGIGAAVVQERRLEAKQSARLSGFAVLLGLACALATAAAAGPIAQFFHEPLLTAVVPVVGLGFFVGAFRVVPAALLAREMRFGRLAAIESTEGLVTMLATLALAVSGAGYWSLVVGSLVGRFVGAIFAFASRPTPIAIPNVHRIAKSLRFGAWVMTSTLAWYVYSNADRFFVGRSFGEVALGAYAIAATFAALPVEKISPLYQRVFESVLARVQDDRSLVGKYLLSITEGVAMLSFPLCLGLVLVADLFVSVALGSHWAPAVIPMQILAFAGATRSLDPPLAQVLVATGHARENARSMIIAAILFPIGFLAVVALDLGVAGVAAVWLIGHPLLVLLRQLHYALGISSLSALAYAKALWPAASASAIMALGVLAARVSMPSVAAPAALAISILAGAAAYAGALWFLHRKRVREMIAIVRGR